MRWAAAAAVILVAGALGVPVIGWVADQVQRLSGEPEVIETGERPDPEISHATSFMVSGSELELRFGSPATRGTLVVERATDALVTLDTSRPEVALTVAGDRIEVGNQSAPDGSYRLLVPRGVTRLLILVSGSEPVVMDLRDGRELPVRVDLEPREPPVSPPPAS